MLPLVRIVVRCICGGHHCTAKSISGPLTVEKERQKQVLGDILLTGKNSHPTFFPSHRSGLNSSTSGPHISALRCMTCTLYSTVPFGIKILLFPSGPPPLGSVMSLFAQRKFHVTTGYSLSASLLQCERYLQLFSAANVIPEGFSYLPKSSRTAARSLAYFSGSRARE